jgi:hypothetical protein
LRPPALWVARKVVDYPNLGVDEYSRKRVESLLQDFSSPEGVERMGDRKKSEEAHMEDT